MGTTSPHFIATPQPDGSEIAAKIVSLVSFSVLSTLFGVKTYNVQYKYLTYSRWLVLALYVLSWAFTVISMLLVTTNNANFTSCFLSIMVCDIFYSGTKLVIYAWLIEKVYIVRSTRESRWKTMSYRLHVLLMMPYVAILSLMLIFHTADLEDSGVCIIGLQSVAAIPLIVYDFAINLYMTIFFVQPLLRLGQRGTSLDRKQSRLHEVALRTLVASIVCLIVSFANIFSLQMLNGRERGLVCLTCCTVDVTINVITIHWVTSQTTMKRTKGNNLDNSSSQQGRDSHPDYASKDFLQFQDATNIRFKQQDTTPIITHGFTDNNNITMTTKLRADSKIMTSATHMEKNTKHDDQASTAEESINSSSSIHESQSSRKSLTKKL